MPMKEGKSKSTISKNIKKKMDSGKPQDQALAICLTYADEYFAGETSSVSDATWSTEAPISTNLRRSKVIFNEDFDIEEAKRMKELGFKVYVRSSRKIQRKDRKTWNKLKSANLTEDNLVFGELKDLDKKYNFDLFLTGEDPLLEALSVRGREINPKKVLKSIPVESIEDAISKQEIELKSIDLKFANIKFFYKYEEIPGIPPAESGSRPFCKRMLQSNRYYTIEEIKQLSNAHLKEMFAKYNGLEPDVFLYRGGFYRLPGTLNTTPWCRHQWTLKIVMD
jgi:hypothetical protein